MAFLLKDYPELATSVGSVTTVKVVVKKEEKKVESKAVPPSGAGGWGWGRGRGGYQGAKPRTVTLPAWLTSEVNFAPLDEKTTALFEDLKKFLRANPFLVRGSMDRFIALLEQCRDGPNDVPMEEATKEGGWTEMDAEYSTMGGFSSKANDDPRCWCWGGGSPQGGGGICDDFCPLHHRKH